MAKKNIRPFDFSKIQKLSSQFLQINRALLEQYPQLSEWDEVGPELLERLAIDLKLKLKCRYMGMDEVTQTNFLQGFSSPCVGIALQSEPQGGQILAELDYLLARMLVDKLLGGKGEPPQELLPLSPMEEGVLEFLILKVFHQLKVGHNLLGPTTLRLNKLVSESKLLAGSQKTEELGIVFKFFLGFEGKGGYFKVYFPHPLIEGVFLREDILAGVRESEEDSSLESRLQRASHVRASLWSEVGRVNLHEGDISQLEVEDVILFDDTMAHMGAHGVSGKTVLRVGDNPSNGLLAEVVDSEGKLVVKVLDFYGGES